VEKRRNAPGGDQEDRRLNILIQEIQVRIIVRIHQQLSCRSDNPSFKAKVDLKAQKVSRRCPQ